MNRGKNDGRDARLFEEGYARAVGLLKECSTEDGFVASATKRDNYHRVWSRDGCIVGLAALMSGDAELIETCRRTIETLAAHQGHHGEIPSNVDTQSGRISYGGTVGRVDGNLWFLICCYEYWRRTEDDAFIERLYETIEKTRFLLGAWEYNARGLLYVPQTGDWADEYIQQGYVLYDQLLYLQAKRGCSALHRWFHGTEDHVARDQNSRLKRLIRANYWLLESDHVPDDVYHEVLYRKAERAGCRCGERHWVPFFSPSGYGYRFDALANTLVSLLDVAEDDQRARVDAHIAKEISQDGARLLPAFDPVITPKDEDWQDLQMGFSYTFKNKPFEYHNGGLWPMVTGFYVVDLARRGRNELAREYLAGIHRSNAMEMDGRDWSFPEFLHGRKHTPGGTARQAWSAAAAVLGHHALEGLPVFTIEEGAP